MGLSFGVHFTILLSLCYAQYRRVTDRRTDRRTDTSLSQRRAIAYTGMLSHVKSKQKHAHHRQQSYDSMLILVQLNIAVTF